MALIVQNHKIFNTSETTRGINASLTIIGAFLTLFGTVVLIIARQTLLNAFPIVILINAHLEEVIRTKEITIEVFIHIQIFELILSSQRQNESLGGNGLRSRVPDKNVIYFKYLRERRGRVLHDHIVYTLLFLIKTRTIPANITYLCVLIYIVKVHIEHIMKEFLFIHIELCGNKEIMLFQIKVHAGKF